MPALPRLLDQLRRAFDGDAWSGPSLLATLDGLTAAQAAAHPLPGAHSIGELVRHLATWSNTVAERIVQQKPVPAVAPDFPYFPVDAQENDWQAALRELREAHERVLTIAAPLAEVTLDTDLGGGVTTYIWLHGTAQHYLYHAGQIVLLRKLL